MFGIEKIRAAERTGDAIGFEIGVMSSGKEDALAGTDV
jgi:hypothetical protein